MDVRPNSRSGRSTTVTARHRPEEISEDSVKSADVAENLTTEHVNRTKVAEETSTNDGPDLSLGAIKRKLRLYREILIERGVDVSDDESSASESDVSESSDDDDDDNDDSYDVDQDPFGDIYVPGVIPPYQPRPNVIQEPAASVRNTLDSTTSPAIDDMPAHSRTQQQQHDGSKQDKEDHRESSNS